MFHNFNLFCIIPENLKCLPSLYLDKMNYQKSQNRRYFETGSDVIKTKNKISFYHLVSDVKFSLKSIEAFSRNSLYKIDKKNIMIEKKETLIKTIGSSVENGKSYLLKN